MATMGDAYPTTSEVLRELDEQGVLLITWNRPERNNAWTSVLQHAYLETLIAAANDPQVRVIVVTGAGKTFCPGRDMQVLQAGADGDSGFDPAAGWPLTTPRLVPKPVIMAVNGACAGLGMVQVASADMVFASTTARFTTSFARRGLTAEYGLAWLLPRLIGTANALDLLLSARLVDAVEAKDMGLVSRLLEPDQLLPVALAYARDLAVNCSPWAMAQIKRQVLADWERPAEEARLHALDLATAATPPDLAEGVASFKEKRPPRFPGVNAGIGPLQSGGGQP
jgi:enoyl-CoA hydratase/carnithine racemase